MSDNDPVENLVRLALDKAGVAYTRDDPLDFECDGFAVECKRAWTPRLVNQISQRSDVIVIQGIGAALAFVRMCDPTD